jgi:hypothetical protein
MYSDVKKIINFIAGYEVGRLAIKNLFLDVTRDGEKGSMAADNRGQSSETGLNREQKHPHTRKKIERR